MRHLLLPVSALLTVAAGVDAMPFGGAWRDNAPAGRRLGDLVISKTGIAVHRLVRYRVVARSSWPGGVLAQVTTRARRDPLGCGRAGRVTYVAMERLGPPFPSTPAGLRVRFYAGTAAPRAADAGRDMTECENHAFRPASSPKER